MALVLGEVVLVLNKVPPLDALYQYTVLPLAPGVAVIVPVPHNVVLEAVGAEGVGFTVITTLLLMVAEQIVAELVATTV